MIIDATKRYQTFYSLKYIPVFTKLRPVITEISPENTPTQSKLCSTGENMSFSFDSLCAKHAQFVNIGKTFKNKEQAWQQVAIDPLPYNLEK